MAYLEDKNNISVMVLVASFYPFSVGGSELQAFRLAKELKKKGVNVYIVSLGLKEVPKNENFDGIQVYRLYSFLNRRLLLGSKKIKKDGPTKIVYESQNPDNFKVTDKKTIFSFIPYFLFFMNVLFFIKRRKEPLDFIYIPTMEWTSFVGVVLAKLLDKKVLVKDSTMNGITNILRYPAGSKWQKFISQNSYFIAMTKAIKKNYLNVGISENRIFMIPNGVDLPDKYERPRENNGKFIFVGNLYQQPAKGVDVLLKAWKIVIKEMPLVQLYIIGDGNLKAYNDYARELGIAGNTHFLGKQSKIHDYLKDSAVFILPSRREGMSNALLEAMSLALPSIVTDISGNQDLIQDKMNGILIPVEDSGAIAKAVMYAYNNPLELQAMGQEARKTIEVGYTFDSVAQKYAELFISLKQLH
jgi:glycosyltransferase involved in cell wall biosynthesis